MSQEITIHHDEWPQTIMELIQWPLMEMGIKVEEVSSDKDQTTYRFVFAEPLKKEE